MQGSDDPRVGTEVAGYRIESLLGWGSMSVDLGEVEAELAGKVLDLQLVREQARRPVWRPRASARSRAWRD